MSECCERKPAGGTGTGTIRREAAGPAAASVPTTAVDPRTTAKYFGIGLSALGTVLAFMMSVIGLSLPEMIILRKVLKFRLIATFAGIVGVGILIVGYLFNALL